ncbi:unnamed protein product [Allacma fusca]|uniref:CRAL-TRIO domain-containing protein n=1 Tax=Allacma fusca TaxID=39272 RepID=A0A8J2L9A8_9HEXA|nr:unnamed protein product [Allacma fusca]
MSTSLVLSGFYFCVLTLALAHDGRGFDDSNSVDSNASPGFTQEFYKKAFSFAPYIGMFTNFTLQDMTNWVNDIVAWQEPLELKQNFPYYISGYDFDNRPIVIVEFGQYKIRELLEKGPRDVENLEKYIQKAGVNVLISMTPRNSSRKDVREISAILDIAGFQYSQGIHVPTLEFARKLTVQYGPLLNVGVDKVVIVNAPAAAFRSAVGKSRTLWNEKIKMDCNAA